MITTIDTKSKLKTVRFVYEDELDLSSITRHDKLIYLIHTGEETHKSILIKKDKKTKWFEMNIVVIKEQVLKQKQYVNLSFDNLQEFKDKIKEIWKLGEKI